MTGGVSLLVLSTADWDRPLWTNKQHLAQSVAALGFEVFYVDSLALRRPSLTRADVRRVGSKVASAVRRRPVPAQRAGTVQVISPTVVPYHRGGPVRTLNSKLLRRSVRSWISRPAEQRVLWTFSPVTYGLERLAAVAVYHAVDLLAEFPGYDALAVRRGEHALAHGGATAIASSRGVRDHLLGEGFESVRLWENVADTDLFSKRSQGVTPEPFHLAFAGNLSPHKVDFSLLNQLLAADPRFVLELAGPVSEGGGDSAEALALISHDQVRYHGVLSPAELASMLGRCTVGLIPYRTTGYTQGVFPMKVYEYLAAGLAVVASGVPSIDGSPGVCVAKDPVEFVAAASAAAATIDAVVREERRHLAGGHSWRSRARQAADLIEELGGTDRRSPSGRL